MTSEQVARLKGWMFAMFSVGIACFYIAYQYTIPAKGTVKE
jgi:hypothetical protein